MAVTQISRIQHRRGLEQDLPQLASAELGWSVDTRQLYIGNGTLAEGAPVIGVTRILTEHDIATITEDIEFTDYTFVGNAAGYTAQTGPSILSPTIRTYQQKLDDFVNVKDFGAKGDGATDDTDAINRALQQIYKSTVSPTDPRARRTIYFPGGTYITTAAILVPPFAKLVGDGVASAIIKQTNGNRSVINVCDSSFQIGASIGTSSAVVPQNIEINGIHFLNANNSVVSPIFVLDSASNVKIQNTKFDSNASAGFYPNLVSVATSVRSTNKITFDTCQFVNAGNAIAIVGTNVNTIRVTNSEFENLSNVCVHLNNSLNFCSIGNYFGSVGGFFISNGANSNFSIGDYYENSNPIYTGIYFGNLQISTTQQYVLTTSPLVLSTLSNSAVALDYEIRSNANARFGTFTYTVNNSGINYNDAYIETNGSVNANVSANNNSILASVTSGTADFKFAFRRLV
jgi:hypothetical protein